MSIILSNKSVDVNKSKCISTSRSEKVFCSDLVFAKYIKKLTLR